MQVGGGAEVALVFEAAIAVKGAGRGEIVLGSADSSRAFGEMAQSAPNERLCHSAFAPQSFDMRDMITNKQS